jgi:hypothetical protein
VLDLFMLAVMILCALLGPADAKRVAVDVYDTKSGKVQTLEIQKSRGGLLLASGTQEPVLIKALGKGKFSFRDQHTLDLSAALSALAKSSEPIQTLEIEKGQVRVTRSKGLTYVAPVGRPELFVIRALPSSSGLAIPPTRPGIDDFAGWEEYEAPWKLTQQLQRERGGHATPEQVAIRFFASLIRGDADYLEALSPNFKPELRKKLQAKLGGETKDIRNFTAYAKITKAKAGSLEGRTLKTFRRLEEAFGAGELMLFGEWNSSRGDTFMLFEQVKGKWYLKGLSAGFARFLFEEGR